MEGQSTGEVYIRLCSEAEKSEALLFDGLYEKKYIEVFETNESEWNQAKFTQFPDKRAQTA